MATNVEGRWNERPVSRRVLLFFSVTNVVVSTSAREYLVTARQPLYSLQFHLALPSMYVRRFSAWTYLRLLPFIYRSLIPRVTSLLSTCCSPSRNIVINLRGINRLLLCACGEEGMEEKIGVRCSPLLTHYCEAFLSIWRRVFYIHVSCILNTLRKSTSDIIFIYNYMLFFAYKLYAKKVYFIPLAFIFIIMPFKVQILNLFFPKIHFWTKDLKFQKSRANICICIHII